MIEPNWKPEKRAPKTPTALKQRGKVAQHWSRVRLDYLDTRKPDHTGYYICDDCHKYTESPEVDHIKKRSTHPELRYEFSNLQLLCHSCHQRKDNGIISSI